jgi:regulator of CtrA degradation
MRNFGGRSETGANTVRLAERRIFSESFTVLYREGMGLVEETAEYLDSGGRAAAKGLSRVAATLYAAESMRLTTRLMQIASWLLLQRAARSGEMTLDQVTMEKKKIRLDTPSASADAEGWPELPEKFHDLVTHSLRLQTRVRALDQQLYGGAFEEPESAGGRNAVTDQIELLKTAFGRG